MNIKYTNYLAFITLLLIPSILIISHAQISIDKEEIDKTLSPQDTRKSFGYCPDASILDKYGVSYTIESCPLSRMYVDNWDKIPSEDRDNIYNELVANGWRIENN